MKKKTKVKLAGIGKHGEMYPLYCPACSHLMIDLTWEEEGIVYPEKQCPICLTIYQLASASREGVTSAKEIILAPRDKEWLKENAEKIQGALPGSW